MERRQEVCPQLFRERPHERRDNARLGEREHIHRVRLGFTRLAQGSERRGILGRSAMPRHTSPNSITCRRAIRAVYPGAREARVGAKRIVMCSPLFATLIITI